MCDGNLGEIYNEGGLLFSNKDLCTSEYTKRMWEKIGEKYLISKFGGQNWNAEMSWKTL